MFSAKHRKSERFQLSPPGEQAADEVNNLCVRAVDLGAAAGQSTLRESLGSGSDPFTPGLSGHIVHSRSQSVASCSLSADSALEVGVALGDSAPNALINGCAGALLRGDGCPLSNAAAVGERICARSDAADGPTDEQCKKLGVLAATGHVGLECAPKRSRFDSGSAPVGASSPTPNAVCHATAPSTAAQMPYAALNHAAFREQSPSCLPYAHNAANNVAAATTAAAGWHDVRYQSQNAGHQQRCEPGPCCERSGAAQSDQERSGVGAFAGGHEQRDANASSARAHHRAGNGSAISKLDPNVVYVSRCSAVQYSTSFNVRYLQHSAQYSYSGLEWSGEERREEKRQIRTEALIGRSTIRRLFYFRAKDRKRKRAVVEQRLAASLRLRLAHLRRGRAQLVLLCGCARDSVFARRLFVSGRGGRRCVGDAAR